VTIAHQLFTELAQSEATLSVAESCTGGGLANEITKHAGISRVFLGSITSYANQVKERLLHIPHQLLEEKGAVSEEVALLMAQNCRDLFSSTWALSTTGIAGPTGATKDKPLGLVFIGIAGPNIVLAKRFVFANSTRLEHREKTIMQAFLLLQELILAG